MNTGYHVENIITVICLTILILLFSGEPDMWDALIDKVKD